MGRKSYQYLPLSKEKYGALKDGVTDSDDRYEIRERLRHTLSNGYVIWQGQGIDPKTFETIEEHGDGVKQRFDKDEIEETKRFRQGLIGWLAFLYAGIGEANNVYLTDLKKFGVVDSSKQVGRVPNIQFDFETMLREAINKAENRRGQYVTDLSLEVETKPLPDIPAGRFDTDELLDRFNKRDPKLTSEEIAYLQQQDAIDGKDWEQYTDEVYDVLE